MADLATQLQERDYRETEGALALADRNRTWSNTFASTPPTEVLRTNRNYDDLLATAVNRKMEIAAQTDPKAQKLFFDARLQPLKEELAIGKIRHQAAATLAQGAATRFQMKKDRETMADTVGFLDGLEKAPAMPGTPAYEAYTLQLLKKFPRFISNAAGKEILKNIAEENDGIAKLNDATVTRYAKVQGELESHKTGVKLEEKSNVANKQADVPYSKSAELHAAQTEGAILEGAHPELKEIAPKPEPTATPKHLGKYNPATGKFE